MIHSFPPVPSRGAVLQQLTMDFHFPFVWPGYLLQKLTAANVGALLVVFFLLVRIYSGWSYIGSRLTSSVIEYEESGWYDGDFEKKSPSEQLRDELLYDEQVKPVVDRLKAFTLATGALWLASCVAYNIALSNKPVFNEYDPAILERLRYDEKLADVAAKQAYGKPTYCDNRYVSNHELLHPSEN